jgi:hypothetical protein
VRINRRNRESGRVFNGATTENALSGKFAANYRVDRRRFIFYTFQFRLRLEKCAVEIYISIYQDMMANAGENSKA